MDARPITEVSADHVGGKHRVVIESIGTAGVGLVNSLRHVSALEDRTLAKRLFQAPAELIGDLDQATARKINQVLLQTGAQTRVLDTDEPLETGDSDHEVALVVRDVAKMRQVVAEVVGILGVGVEDAVRMVCQSPAVLIGNISANTVQALAKRFEPLGVAVDVARPAQSIFDVFLGPGSQTLRAAARNKMRELGIALQPDLGPDGRPQPLLATGLTLEQSLAVWDATCRSSMNLKIINRDFERYDVRLDAAPHSPQIVEYLVESTKMPVRTAEKVLRNLPIIIHQQIRFADLAPILTEIAERGGQASGHLLSFQTFDLQVGSLRDVEAAWSVLKVMGQMAPAAAPTIRQQLTHAPTLVEGPFSLVQARWLVWELKQIGAEAELRSR